jgi:hypothetical protein
VIVGGPDDERGARLTGAATAASASELAPDDLILVVAATSPVPTATNVIVIAEGGDDADAGERGRGGGRGA